MALLLTATLLLIAVGCDEQGQARLTAETPRGPTPVAVELAKVRAELAQARTKLSQARGRTYDLEGRIDSLERQLATFDSQGLARKARKERERSAALTDEIASLQRKITKARYERDAPPTPSVSRKRKQNPEDAIPLVEKVFGRKYHGR